MFISRRRPVAHDEELLRKMELLNRRSEDPLLDPSLDVKPETCTDLCESGLISGEAVIEELHRDGHLSLLCRWAKGSRIVKHYHALENCHVSVASGQLAARIIVEEEISPSVLTPTTPYLRLLKGTLHDLEALTDCVFLLTFEPWHNSISTK